MSTEHADEVVTFKVQLSPTRDGPCNRIVVYDWFSRGEKLAPPRGGNSVEVLVDGEAGWGRVADDLERAEHEIQIATWMCRPDIELRRPLELAVAEPGERGRFRLGEILERRAEAGAKVRLLIWGLVYTPIIDRWMRRWYWRGRDSIDVLEQDHPSIIGSHHQKTMTIDGRVGYCGGMNLKENDWDTCAHVPHDARRCPHTAGSHERRPIAARMRTAPFAPRHDLIVRIEGPAVADLVMNFSDRWRQSVKARRASMFGRLMDSIRRLLGNDDYPEVRPLPMLPPVAGGHWAQIVRTTPGGEDGILGAYVRAIRNARRYIYIENQYFRSPCIGKELRDVLSKNPRLRLAVVVRPVNGGKASLWDPSGYWTAHTLKLIREARPDFELTVIHAWGRDADDRLVWQEVDVHAKVMVVDDVWLTVGSANINDRGFKTEGEINAVVLDRGLAQDLRKRLMSEHLELPLDDPRLDDVDETFDLWEEHGRENPRRMALGEEPCSRVHHFVQEGLARPPFGVGSGVF
ncbi:phospholipase D-like domain-containing protein [Paraliomyxa miuraensis]|uniref:phospholipase D-like domain-containing protein n=1 Tax=Paraliomyxa miuraensis TaxID=376150 RepID=UPI00224CEF8A|nr:phosphatidylserine/phosphatidylglycerophosphate/cardiolipin synthase family protein [Paraliomyxa miuraensis]MCX4242912.1 phosphatidylserine/phosphatidylglycerophosphate/cardiolipin synthase family protein [Paraliomyxa miuraensis]